MDYPTTIQYHCTSLYHNTYGFYRLAAGRRLKKIWFGKTKGYNELYHSWSPQKQYVCWFVLFIVCHSKQGPLATTPSLNSLPFLLLALIKLYRCCKEINMSDLARRKIMFCSQLLNSKAIHIYWLNHSITDSLTVWCKCLSTSRFRCRTHVNLT